VSLRSTPGYGLTSLRDGKAKGDENRFAQPKMKRSTASRGAFAILVALPLLPVAASWQFSASLPGCESGTAATCGRRRRCPASTGTPNLNVDAALGGLEQLDGIA
jgi:hypothetical protein